MTEGDGCRSGGETAQFADGPAVRMALAVATAELRDAGCETPRLDAELLLADALGTTRTQLHLAPERELTHAESDRFAELLRRRRAREPVAYMLGKRAFRYIELTVDERVLVPRPESEGLVEAALTLPRGRARASTSAPAAARSRSRSSTSGRTSRCSAPT